MKRQKVSGFVPCQNSEAVIRECLESLRWCDEVLVVDSYSTDRTLDIVREFENTRILQHEYTNSVEQRIWGMPQVAYDWVFIIDSDERCSPKLREEIEQILGLDEITYDGYLIHIRTEYKGKLLKHDSYLGSGGKRLVRKEMWRNYKIKQVHSGMRIDNKTWIKNPQAYLVHVPILDLGKHWQKMIRYACWSADDMNSRGKKVYFYHFLFRPFFKFLQYYLIRGGIRDGMRGLLLCLLGGLAVFMKFARLWELRQQ